MPPQCLDRWQNVSSDAATGDDRPCEDCCCAMYANLRRPRRRLRMDSRKLAIWFAEPGNARQIDLLECVDICMVAARTSNLYKACKCYAKQQTSRTISSSDIIFGLSDGSESDSNGCGCGAECDISSGIGPPDNTQISDGSDDGWK